MAVVDDDFLLFAWPILAGESSVQGADVPLAPVGFGLRPSYPAVLADGPEWLVRVVRPPAMTVVEEIIPDPDAQEGRTFDESHVEQANELGRFAFSTFDVDGFDITHGDLVEFYDRGLCIGGGVIRASETVKLSRSAEGKPYTTWTGTRPLGVLEEGPVLPARGEGSIAQDRIWGWFGVTYEPVGWSTAVHVVRMDGTSQYWTGLLPGFNDQTAYWVWGPRRVGDPPLDEWSPIGTCLFRQTGTVPAEVTEVEIELAADAQAELFFEGESVMTTVHATGNPEDVARRRVAVIAESEVLVAIRAINNLSAGDMGGAKFQNPGGVAWSVWALDPGTGERTSVIMHSDSSALLLAYPSALPGVTPGHALLEVLNELQALGFFTWVVPTFTADVDSHGRPWAEVGELGTKVGYSPWKFLSQLIAVYVDTDLTPGTNEWHAWSKGTRGSGRNVTLTPASSDPETGNLTEHTITRTHARATDIFSFSKYGWQMFSRWDGTSRRVAATVGHGALPSQEAVRRYAEADLDEYGEDRIEHDVAILPVGDSDKPYWAYGIGDTVTIDGDVEPVVEIRWHRDRNGRIHWDQDEDET